VKVLFLRQNAPNFRTRCRRGFAADPIFFITICCTPRETNQLCNESVATIIWESIEFRQSRRDWFVYLWLLMPDHLHALISFPQDSNPTKVIANWKEITAKKTGIIVWQSDVPDGGPGGPALPQYM
jgi:REP element-mobilizing transposase RayT